MSREQTLEELLKRPSVTYAGLMTLPGAGPGIEDPVTAEQVETQIKYAGYIQRQMNDIERLKKNEETVLPDDLDYQAIKGLSSEVAEKLSHHRPATIGQATRIPGITPAAISILLVYLKKSRLQRSA
jgi:tRNA uridine 5-carboxymethylaminomethyl modification enzyme